MEECALGRCWQRQVLEEGKWTGAVSGSGRDAQSSHDVIAEEGLVGGAALPNGADGVVVVVAVEESSFGDVTN